MNDTHKMIVDANDCIDHLTALAEQYGVLSVCKPILNSAQFKTWSASSKPHRHHYGQGGLIVHTAEVVHLCENIHLHYLNVYDIDYGIDEVELFLAAFFHDLGKMYDYEPDKVDMDEIYPDQWRGTEHKRLIHNVSRSAIIWSELARTDIVIYRKYHEPVLHAILSHHGQREHGSPVAPKTRVAWLVHFCDGISARMHDADTLDILYRDTPQ